MLLRFKSSLGTQRLFLLFICISFNIYQVFTHELWRDETQGWLIATNSSNFEQLLQSKDYEIQPPTWYIFLFLISRISSSTLMLQFAQIAISALSYAVIIFWLRLKVWVTCLVLASFYLSFGMTVIARDYVLLIVPITLLIGLVWRNFDFLV